jgi:hypothetical protein
VKPARSETTPAQKRAITERANLRRELATCRALLQRERARADACEVTIAKLQAKLDGKTNDDRTSRMSRMYVTTEFGDGSKREVASLPMLRDIAHLEAAEYRNLGFSVRVEDV